VLAVPVASALASVAEALAVHVRSAEASAVSEPTWKKRGCGTSLGLVLLVSCGLWAAVLLPFFLLPADQLWAVFVPVVFVVAPVAIIARTIIRKRSS
jgi:hypothetical protein